MAILQTNGPLDKFLLYDENEYWSNDMNGYLNVTRLLLPELLTLWVWLISGRASYQLINCVTQFHSFLVFRIAFYDSR